MAFEATKYLSRVKGDLGITDDAHNSRLLGLIEEAVASLALFLAAPPETLSALQYRYVRVYVAMEFDGTDLAAAKAQTIDWLREQ